MPYTLRLIRHELGIMFDRVSWVVNYDPEYHWPDGHYDGGLLMTTWDESQARRFYSPESAIRYWRSGPSCECHYVRPDGERNRPLTAFSCEVVWYDG